MVKFVRLNRSQAKSIYHMRQHTINMLPFISIVLSVSHKIDGEAPIISPSETDKTVLPSENVQFSCKSNEPIVWKFVGVSALFHFILSIIPFISMIVFLHCFAVSVHYDANDRLIYTRWWASVWKHFVLGLSDIWARWLLLLCKKFFNYTRNQWDGSRNRKRRNHFWWIIRRRIRCSYLSIRWRYFLLYLEKKTKKLIDFTLFLFNLDPTNPIAYTLSYITGNQNEDVIIPCKPTSKQFQVQLFKEGDEVTKPHNINFNGDLSLFNFKRIINNSECCNWANANLIIFLELHIIQTFLVQNTIIAGDFNAYIGTRIKNLQQNDATDYYCRLNKSKQQFTLNVRRMCISILIFSVPSTKYFCTFSNFMLQNIACSRLLLLKRRTIHISLLSSCI